VGWIFWQRGLTRVRACSPKMRPAGLSPATGAPGAPAAPAWEPAWSSANKQWYYQDRRTGESSWGRPPGCTVELPRQPPSEVPQSVSAVAANLPPGWEAEWDPTHKRHYYYNLETKERLWKPPPGTGAVVAAAAAAPGREEARPSRLAAPAPAGPEASPRTPVRSPVPDIGRRGTPQRGAGRATAWDAEAFRQRVAQARATGEIRAVKSVLREVSEHNYTLRDQWPVPRTVHVTLQRCLQSRPTGHSRAPELTFSASSTADAALHFALAGGGRKVVALNFANGSTVGGGYKNGATAQEEDLCRRFPCLYTSLNNANREGLYPFGPSTCSSPDRPAKYSDVLWTPGAILARAGEVDGFSLLPPERQVAVSLVAAAAPNLRFANPPELNDSNLMYDAIKAILIAPKVMQPEVTTIILGAWGCGAFGGNPDDISELFCRALSDERLGRLYKEVHFAILESGRGEDRNAKVFREALRKHGLTPSELNVATSAR